MGNCSFQSDSLDPTVARPVALSKALFQYLYPIGKGGFGKVWRVELRSSHQIFAMKEMLKSRVVSKRSVSSVLNERKLLSLLKHPFIVNMLYAFQDRDNLYLVMDLMHGGDLRFHIGRQKRFSEEQTKFFVACLLTGLEYLHVNSVIHRDIKPENLVLDSRGYLRITDFGIARVLSPDNSQDTSGTPGYMAPEVMCRMNHGIAVDYFAVGVIVYEFMMGRRPYSGRNRKEIKDQILAKQAQLKRGDIPEGWSVEAADFTNKLLQRKPQNRLGYNGPQEAKNHAWLRGFPWQKLMEKRLEAPFKPEEVDNFDPRHLGEWNDQEALEKSAEAMQEAALQNLFAGYHFDGTRKQGAVDQTVLLNSKA